MPDVVKHAWTHRPRAQGGTDPIEMPAIVWAKAGASSMTASDVSNTYRLTFDTLYSNDAAAFAAADVTFGRANWIQLNTPGMYLMRCSLRAESDLGAFNTNIAPLFELSSSPAALNFNLGIEDFIGIFGTFIDEIRVSQPDTTSGLYTEFSFNWDPSAGIDAIDTENPLKVGLSLAQAGGPATINMAGDFLLVRLCDPGYVDLSP